MRRYLKIAIVLGALFFAARWLGLLDPPAARAYKKFAFYRDHRMPADAKSWATGPGLDAILPLADQTIDSAHHRVLTTTVAKDGLSAEVRAQAEVCVAGSCARTFQTATVCKLDTGWRVCNFAESPAP